MAGERDGLGLVEAGEVELEIDENLKFRWCFCMKVYHFVVLVHVVLVLWNVGLVQPQTADLKTFVSPLHLFGSVHSLPPVHCQGEVVPPLLRCHLGNLAKGGAVTGVVDHVLKSIIIYICAVCCKIDVKRKKKWLC